VTALAEPPAESVVAAGKYLAVLFDPTRGWGEYVAKLAAKYPHWISSPTAPEDRERVLFGMVTNPMHLAWEVWKDAELVGIILLTDISPLVDARMHFAFFDGNLIGKTGLLRRFLAYCFTDLRFQRISVQAPVFSTIMLSYYRRKLRFRYEGELATKKHQIVAQWRRQSPGENVNVWIASVGSRRERAHWHEGQWHDVLCLRITAPEFNQGDPCPPLPSSPPPQESSGRSSATT